MARRKKRSAPSRRKKSRKMGAIGKSFLMDAAGLVAGAVAARILTASEKIFPKVDAKLKSAGVIAIGAFLPKFVKGSFGKAVGDGMIAAGGIGILQAYGTLGQIDDAMEIPVSVMAGDGLSVMAGDDLSVMAGYSPDNLSVIAGMEEEYC
jgi:ethanolamine utilization microcompartment shell protein EutL